ncbi:IS3 family transposase, partial [Secundilactobacillus similis]|uniref:IS3 family transposase n=1 Tax=Secundilactobacillus similis TaxID=414682 RepID=UPI000ADE1939
MILKIYADSFKTYGYRRISKILENTYGLHVGDAKLRELMKDVGIDNTLYNEHTAHYSSFKGDQK